jgi:fucose 4-O-acetylase-like acetyltransferase
MNMEQKQRLDWIDAARAFGIFLVVWAHFFVNGDSFRKYLYIFHMPLFFFISGYLLKVGAEPFISFKKNTRAFFPSIILSKFIRLIVPFWIYLIVLEPPLSLIFRYRFNLQNIIGDFTFLHGRISAVPLWAMWFLPTLFLSWIISYCIIRFFKSWFLQAAVVFFCILVSFYSGHFPEILKAFGFLRLFAVIPFCVTGYWCKKYALLDKIKKSDIKFAVPLLVIIGTVVGYIINRTYYVTIHRYQYGNYIYLFISALAMCLAVFLVASRIKTYPKAIIFLGRNSIFVMATHPFIAIIWRGRLAMLTPPPPPPVKSCLSSQRA